MKITKTAVDRLTIPNTGYALHWDDTLPGFGVRATGIKSFILQARVHGRQRRITLGRHGVLTVTQARSQAKRLAGEIAGGRDPIAERAQAQLIGVTLSEALGAYLLARKDLKPRTRREYRAAVEQVLADWGARPLAA